MMRFLSMASVVLIGALASLGDAATAGARSVCADLGGDIQSGNICKASVTTPAYVIDLRFRSDYADQHGVADFLTQERSHLMDLVQTPGAQRLPYDLYVTWEFFTSGSLLSTTQQGLGYGQPPHGTQSLVLTVYTDAEGAGQTARNRMKAFNYDLNQNRPVTFASLFAPGTNPMDMIYPAVATDLARQQKPRDFRLSPDAGRDPAHYQNFAITDDAVTFFFDAGEFFPVEAGDARVTIPRALLPPLQV